MRRGPLETDTQVAQKNLGAHHARAVENAAEDRRVKYAIGDKVEYYVKSYDGTIMHDRTQRGTVYRVEVETHYGVVYWIRDGTRVIRSTQQRLRKPKEGK